MGSPNVIVLLTILSLATAQQLNSNSFPDDFLMGTATAAYQIEGAWNESDKSENIWDHLTHNYPERIRDRSNGDVACDSYHLIDEDVALLRNLGVDFYRFSISWSRLLPSSSSNIVSEDGLRYYNELIDALVAANIAPMVTLYHWDLPQELQLLGGWANPTIADYFADYAQVAFENFGDRVRYWITFNEPQSFCSGYSSETNAPANVAQPGIADYLCVYTMLLGHARAYHIYDEQYRSTQNGLIGITLDSFWYEPNTTSADDIAAAERTMQFSVGLYGHPIFSQDGDFPQVVKDAVAQRSALEGFPYSRLPNFTEEEIQYIRGTSDFLGFNHYTTQRVSAREPDPIGEPSRQTDTGVSLFFDLSWETSASTWLRVVPWGFRRLLLWLQNEYGYPIYITENGFSDTGEIDDYRRVNYYQTYLSAVLDAIDQGANVRAYTAWSLLDNFEWNDGYLNRFGIHYVNMSDPARPRTIKRSGEYLRQVFATRRIIESTSGGTLSVVVLPVTLLLLFISTLVLV